MAFVTNYQHGSFILSAEALIKKIEEQDNGTVETTDVLTELKNDITMLNQMFSESQAAFNKLCLLVDQYKQTQHKTRVKLRVCRIKYAR
ncbi:MAG: hypothetical protein QM802_07280 [Agriterribacter sp.]